MQEVQTVNMQRWCCLETKEARMTAGVFVCEHMASTYRTTPTVVMSLNLCHDSLFA